MDYRTMVNELKAVNDKRVGYCALCFASIYNDEQYKTDEKGFIFCQSCYDEIH